MGSLYWRQFMLGAGMVLLTMVLLGVSFYALSYNYTVSEKRSEMRDRANLIAQLSVSYLLPSDEAAATQEDALRALAGVASRMTDVDFLICNRDGDVLLTSDAGLVGKSVRVPEEIVTRTFAEDDGYEGRSTVGVYEQKKFVVGVPMTGEDGAVLGLVLAVMDGTALMEMWRSFIGLFFMLSAIILLVAFVASSVTSMKQIKPITEMVQATRAYADGNFDVRMQETSSGGEIGELATAFNAMADSLQETERQRRDFIANVSHELKTPMTTIAGFIDGILDGTIPKEQEDKYLHIVSDEVKRLSRLVKSMLDLSRIDSGEMQLHPTNFDITNTIVTTLLTFEQKIDEKGIEIRGLEEARPQMVLGDQDLLHQVVYNLIENAVKFTNDGGAISVQVSDSIDRTTVVIENTGPGIAPEDLPMIFERFYKTDKSRSRDKNGMGLGLYIVRTILKLHGGDIAVSSAVGQFCRFEFYIPKPQEAPKLKDTGSFKLKDASYRSKAKEKKATKAEKPEREEPERSKEDDGRPEE